MRMVAAGACLLNVHRRNAAIRALGERGSRGDQQLRRCHDGGDCAHRPEKAGPEE